jgi:hypothetical protein
MATGKWELPGTAEFISDDSTLALSKGEKDQEA